MDRMLYVSMAGAKQIMRAQTMNTHNLANANTPGFRADMNLFRAVPVNGPGLDSRVYAVNDGSGVDLSAGTLRETGRDLDVAVRGEGFFAVQTADGGEAYTRAGNFTVSPLGQLLTATGEAVLGDGGPIAIPPYEKLDIGVDGTISILPLGQSATALAVVDRIKMVNMPAQDAYKGEDGLLRSREEESLPADASIQLVSGSLENSNVNAIGAMVNMIELSRQFEMQMKLMQSAKENDRAADAIMRLG